MTKSLRNIIGAYAIIALTLALLATTSAAVYEYNRDREVYWEHIFWNKFTLNITWVILVPVIFYVVTKFPFRIPRIPRLVFIHFIIGMIIAPLHKVIWTCLDYVLQCGFDLFHKPIPTFADHLQRNFLCDCICNLIWYYIIAFSLYAYTIYDQGLKNEIARSNLNSQLALAKIQNLKTQLRPHFLFNTLQSISALIYKDAEKAESAIAKLSDLLRISFERNDAIKIELSEELDFIRSFAKLQELRFGDRLQIQIDCDQGLRKNLVPPMIIQPFLENSIKHGLEKWNHKINVDISIDAIDNALRIAIRDNGATEEIIEEGTGITNTRSRLASLYGNNFSLNYGHLKPRGFEVVVSITVEQDTA